MNMDENLKLLREQIASLSKMLDDYEDVTYDLMDDAENEAERTKIEEDRRGGALRILAEIASKQGIIDEEAAFRGERDTALAEKQKYDSALDRIALMESSMEGLAEDSELRPQLEREINKELARLLGNPEPDPYEVILETDSDADKIAKRDANKRLREKLEKERAKAMPKVKALAEKANIDYNIVYGVVDEEKVEADFHALEEAKRDVDAADEKMKKAAELKDKLEEYKNVYDTHKSGVHGIAPGKGIDELIAAKQAKMRELQTKKDERKTLVDDKKKCEDDIRRLEAEKQKVLQEIEKINAQIKAYEKLEKTPDVLARINELKAKLGPLSDKIIQIDKDIETKRNEILAYDTQIAAKDVEIQTVTQDLENCINEINGILPPELVSAIEALISDVELKDGAGELYKLDRSKVDEMLTATAARSDEFKTAKGAAARAYTKTAKPIMAKYGVTRKKGQDYIEALYDRLDEIDAKGRPWHKHPELSEAREESPEPPARDAGRTETPGREAPAGGGTPERGAPVGGAPVGGTPSRGGAPVSGPARTEAPARAEAPAGGTPARAEAPAGGTPARTEAPAGGTPARAEAPTGGSTPRTETPTRSGNIGVEEDGGLYTIESRAKKSDGHTLEGMVAAHPEMQKIEDGKLYRFRQTGDEVQYVSEDIEPYLQNTHGKLRDQLVAKIDEIRAMGKTEKAALIASCSDDRIKKLITARTSLGRRSATNSILKDVRAGSGTRELEMLLALRSATSPEEIVEVLESTRGNMYKHSSDLSSTVVRGGKKGLLRRKEPDRILHRTDLEEMRERFSHRDPSARTSRREARASRGEREDLEP